MRWTIPALTFALLAVVPAAAEERREVNRAEFLKLARLAQKAQLKIGDILLEKGDVKGALQAYAKATAILDEALTQLDPDGGGENVRLQEGAGGRFGGRVGRRRVANQDAVKLGLQWLAENQDVNNDGKWDCDAHGGGALFDVGVTGLSTLAFLGAGYTDRGAKRENKYAKNVRMAVRYLMTSQDKEGCFGTRATQSFMYNHAIATLAMTETYWMTRNPRYKRPAQEGLNFLARARNPHLAWRYDVRGGENDTGVTGWCVMALKSGTFAGLEVDAAAFQGARAWIDKMTDPQFGNVGYITRGGTSARPEGLQDQFPPEKSQAMTASGILTRIFCGEDPRTSELIKKGAKLCAELPPRWDGGRIDMYYWYVGTLAMFQVGGDHWKKWNASMKDAIVRHQHVQGKHAGSWDAAGPWGRDGGRVMSTALMTMCLEVYYRYDRVFGHPLKPKPKAPAPPK